MYVPLGMSSSLQFYHVNIIVLQFSLSSKLGLFYWKLSSSISDHGQYSHRSQWKETCGAVQTVGCIKPISQWYVKWFVKSPKSKIRI